MIKRLALVVATFGVALTGFAATQAAAGDVPSVDCIHGCVEY